MTQTRHPAASAGSGLRPLYRRMTPRRRRHLFGLLGVMALAAATEIMAIAAVVPFVAALAGSSPPGLAARLLPDFMVREDATLAASSLLVGAAAAAAAVRLALMRVASTFATGFGHDVGTTIFGRMLRQPYLAHLGRHSSEILSGVEKIQTLVAGTLLPLVSAATALVVGAGIAAALLVISPFGTAVGAGFVAGSYLLVSVAAHRRLARNSAELARLATQRIKALQEALGAIRDILIGRSQTVFEERFRKLDARFRRAQAANLFLAGAPRYLVEAAGIAAVVLVALVLSAEPGGLLAALPSLAALALGAQRLLPMAQQAWLGWTKLTGNRHALADILALLDMPVAEEPAPRAGALAFEREIVFDRVAFDYPGSRAGTLRDVRLRIARGARIGIAGETGSGKSTLVDLLMGLLEPSAGEIRIDGRGLDRRTRSAWQAQIAHVPQSTYLADESIAANIAFGVPPDEIDEARLREAARLAGLDHFVAKLPDGLETRVGECGVRLSGGERQRIGLARALYSAAELLILDEATSALDEHTEAAVLNALASLEALTIIVVAHRPSGLANCDQIVRLERGRIVPRASGSYSRQVQRRACSGVI